ncbi:MAG: TonB-dependent receptor [Acidobacteria bacterium]|nr:MAG: TonB-dependent receptor [Acidobacteriota bacterium]
MVLACFALAALLGATPSLTFPEHPNAPAAAREEAGSLHGVVVDPGGSRVPGAQVLLATAVGIVARTEADSLGQFRFAAVPPGRYEVRVSAPGLIADPVPAHVAAGQPLEVTVSLRLSALVESVVVSAAQVEMPLTRTATSVAVLSRADMDARQVETPSDALRGVPGFSVSRNGGRGAVTSLFPRGGESDFTLVLVDGVKLNSFGGGFDFATLPSADIERVEVVRGPESALHGADAVGGVVHVVTRHGGSPRAEGTIEGGSQDTLRLSAGTWGSRGRVSWGAAAGRWASDGFTGIAPATGETVSNDDMLQKDLSGSGSWRPTAGTDLRLTARLASHERGYPGPFGSNPIGAYTAVDRLSRGLTTQRQYAARWLQPLPGTGQRGRLSASAGYLDQSNDFESSFGLSASGTRRVDARAAASIDLASSAAVSFGGEWQSERATSTFITGEAFEPVPIDRHALAGFAEVRLVPHSQISLTAGLRAEQIRRDALAQSLDPYSPRPTFGAHEDTAISPRVSGAFSLPRSGRVFSWTRVHAAAGTGMRAPDALEIAFTDNPDLQPERSRSLEAGVDQALLGDRLVLAATAFANRYDNLIVAVGPVLTDASRYRTDNISNARSRGVETSAALRTPFGLDLRATYTFLDTEILGVDGAGMAPPPFEVGDPLLRRPRHQGSLDVVFVRGPLTAFGRLGARGRTLDVEPSYGTFGGLYRNPGHSVIDAGATWRLARGLEVFGRATNLLDTRYEETFGFPALGRTVAVGVRLAAGR